MKRDGERKEGRIQMYLPSPEGDNLEGNVSLN